MGKKKEGITKPINDHFAWPLHCLQPESKGWERMGENWNKQQSLQWCRVKEVEWQAQQTRAAQGCMETLTWRANKEGQGKECPEAVTVLRKATKMLLACNDNTNKSDKSNKE